MAGQGLSQWGKMLHMERPLSISETLLTHRYKTGADAYINMNGHDNVKNRFKVRIENWISNIKVYCIFRGVGKIYDFMTFEAAIATTSSGHLSSTSIFRTIYLFLNHNKSFQMPTRQKPLDRVIWTENDTPFSNTFIHNCCTSRHNSHCELGWNSNLTAVKHHL